MVHNGIQYGDMQLISEAYFIMKHTLGFEAQDLHDVFSEWNKGELNSYLIEVTAEISTKMDEDTGKPLIDLILDVAGQKTKYIKNQEPIWLLIFIFQLSQYVLLLIQQYLTYSKRLIHLQINS